LPREHRVPRFLEPPCGVRPDHFTSLGNEHSQLFYQGPPLEPLRNTRSGGTSKGRPPSEPLRNTRRGGTSQGRLGQHGIST
jgi:hypothetical protein